MELLKDYDCTIKYHSGKANVVANALSQKMVEISVGTICYERENLVALWALNINLDVEEDHLLVALQVKPSLVDQIKDAQMDNAYMKKMKEKVKMGSNTQLELERMA